MPKVLRTSQANEDLLEIWLHVAEADLAQADRLLDTIYEKCLMLAEFPASGRARHELIVGLRSFAVKNYVVFYQPLIKFCDGCLVHMTDTYFGRDRESLNPEEIDLPNPPSRDEIEVPFFSE